MHFFLVATGKKRVTEIVNNQFSICLLRQLSVFFLWSRTRLFFVRLWFSLVFAFILQIYLIFLSFVFEISGKTSIKNHWHLSFSVCTITWLCCTRAIFLFRKMEISETTINVYYACRLFGFAPYSLIRKKNNEIVSIESNKFLCIYSILLFTTITCCTVYGLYYDSTSEHSIRWNCVNGKFSANQFLIRQIFHFNSSLPFESFKLYLLLPSISGNFTFTKFLVEIFSFDIRLKNATARIVTGSDVLVVVVCVFLGILSSVFGFNNVKQFNHKLRKVRFLFASSMHAIETLKTLRFSVFLLRDKFNFQLRKILIHRLMRIWPNSMLTTNYIKIIHVDESIYSWQLDTFGLVLCLVRWNRKNRWENTVVCCFWIDNIKFSIFFFFFSRTLHSISSHFVAVDIYQWLEVASNVKHLKVDACKCQFVFWQQNIARIFPLFSSFYFLYLLQIDWIT